MKIRLAVALYPSPSRRHTLYSLHLFRERLPTDLRLPVADGGSG